jgi:TonB family protein
MTRVRFATVALVIAGIALVSLARAQERVYDRKEEGVKLPAVVKSVKANYTPEALQAHIEGTVTMSVIVQSDGKVGEVAITQSLDKKYGLDDAAVNAMKQWEFTPGTKDGNPVPVRVDVEMTFHMK